MRSGSDCASHCTVLALEKLQYKQTVGGHHYFDIADEALRHCDGVHKPHPGEEGVKELFWAQATLPCQAFGRRN